MLHPSYSDLMKVVNSEVEQGEAPVVNSRYSIVMATSKRARQIIGGEEPLVKAAGKKPLSVAIEELNQAKIRILSEEEAEHLREQEEAMKSQLGENVVILGEYAKKQKEKDDGRSVTIAQDFEDSVDLEDE